MRLALAEIMIRSIIFIRGWRKEGEGLKSKRRGARGRDEGRRKEIKRGRGTGVKEGREGGTRGREGEEQE